MITSVIDIVSLNSLKTSSPLVNGELDFREFNIISITEVIIGTE
jgi:hypothetical protein